MSKKDFDKYVLVIKKQYEDFKNNLDQIALEAQSNMTDIDYVSRLQNQVMRYKENYERVMFIKYLLDQPVKKSKINSFKKQTSKNLNKLDNCNNLNNVLKENESIINNLGK